MKDPRYECLRDEAQALMLGMSRLAGDETIPDDELQEAVVEFVAAKLYWTAVDAGDRATKTTSD